MFFFFSSRRRHTRFDCDWSSDVCSSDLKRHSHVGLHLPVVMNHPANRRQVDAAMNHLPASAPEAADPPGGDRKSTRLNSSHSQISYAVFCLKKKKLNTPSAYSYLDYNPDCYCN